jgi:hypothetical protein
MTDIEPMITTSSVATLLGYPIGTTLLRCTEDPLLLRSNYYLAFHPDCGWSVAAIDEDYPADTRRYAAATDDAQLSAMVKTVTEASWWPDLSAVAQCLSPRLHGVLASTFDLLVERDPNGAVAEWMRFARTHPQHARQVAELFSRP